MEATFNETPIFGLNTWIDPNIEIPTLPPVDTNMGMLDGLLDKAGGLQGLGSLASAIGGIMGGIEQRKYQKELLDMEKKRIERDRARQEKFEGDMKSSWN